jgi:hypothetical protein
MITAGTTRIEFSFWKDNNLFQKVVYNSKMQRNHTMGMRYNYVVSSCITTKILSFYILPVLGFHAAILCV